MIAAPGVPGGAIMAAVGVIQSVLGFDEELIGLIITVYLAVDSFGTACNVTCDGALAVIIDKIAKKGEKTIYRSKKEEDFSIV
jgi:Na+/H+-dicarboxylate symporter